MRYDILKLAFSHTLSMGGGDSCSFWEITSDVYLHIYQEGHLMHCLLSLRLIVCELFMPLEYSL